MIIDEADYLAHYGILRKSGRYPWGSGGSQNTRNKMFLDYVSDMRRQGLSDVEIARGLSTDDHPFTTSMLRAGSAIAGNQQRAAKIAEAERLKTKGLSTSAIARKMELPEATVRGYLKPGAKDRADVLQSTANMLKDQVAEKGYIDVGSGVSRTLGISQTKLANAVSVLKEQGYGVHYVKQFQPGTGNFTNMIVLAKPGTSYSEVYANRGNIRPPFGTQSDNGGRTYYGIHPPLNISSKRVDVVYGDKGGADADGVMYVRPGVPDVSLGSARYAQVRVSVDGTHYIKGMAVYKDGLPPGVDIQFNTNKHDTGNKLDALKPLKEDKQTKEVDLENPFGAVVDQIGERAPNGDLIKVTSVMNVVNEEGSWDKWSRTLSSQFLSKQSPKLAKTQLDMTYENKKLELDDIMKLTNPAVKRKLLTTFADSADSSAVHLKAAHLPRQANHVILPVKSLKETEVYAPNYANGTRVVLIRHPHGGPFEIPELVVNNKNREALALIKQGKDEPVRDAIGIHPNVAKRLSGADFDGDTVLVIPNDRGLVKTSPALSGLKDFDPVHSYPAYDGMKRMTARTKGIEMGDISNLITDMSIQKASNEELARAVRHSMVVIDAEKHNLNYRQSAKDNGISQLKQKYQGRGNAGAATLISRAGSKKIIPDRRAARAAEGGPIDPATGKQRFVETGKGFTTKEGTFVPKTQRIKKLALTDDANTLVSKDGGTVIEKVYADHSNKLKELANRARRETLNIKDTPISSTAKQHYAKEVTSLTAQLHNAERNRPLERQALVLANAAIAAKKAAHPEMDDDDKKKLQFTELERARERTGAKRHTIKISDDEWKAIQAGAISTHHLNQILQRADLDQVKKLATPRTPTVMSAAKQRRAEAMLASGYTQAEIASALGVAPSTLQSALERAGG